jgi:hypothetical protein
MADKTNASIPPALLSLPADEYARVEPLSEQTIRVALEKGRIARKAAEEVAPHPTVTLKVRFR